MKSYAAQVGFHNRHDANVQVQSSGTSRAGTEFTYTFENFFQPFVGELIKTLNQKSLPGLLDATYHQSLTTQFFNDFYKPSTSTSPVVKLNHFPKEIDVSTSGPYANYNWELLFHIPLTIAVHLSKTQRFSEAQRWFHYIFDPTSNDPASGSPQGSWKFLAFRQQQTGNTIDEILRLLSVPRSQLASAEQQLQDAIMEGYTEILNRPFQPHAVARTRPIAYQYSVVMKYLDNLIAWGDFLFRQDTIESINEA